MNSNTNNNIIILILVQILFYNNVIIRILVQILFCQFLENGNRYKAENLRLHYFFNGLSNDISHFIVA